ncbi:hypothetical protein ACQ86O_21125 [Serratia sp. L9]|uniref:hypothetical protein n=1 Tax=Serratia sp. L9 TaxID=3423946 RepID=UPI003D67B3D4
MRYLLIFFMLLPISANSTFKIGIFDSKVVCGISNCTMTKASSNTWKSTFSLSWLKMPENPPISHWGGRTGRGFLIFLYDNNGHAMKTYLPAVGIAMDSYNPAGSNLGEFTRGNGYLTYGDSTSNGWKNFPSAQLT